MKMDYGLAKQMNDSTILTFYSIY